MSQPPDSQEPPDDEPKIVEPPFEPQSDTRPLKPLQIRRRAASDQPPLPPENRPPATVLQEATSSPPSRLSKRLLPVIDGDTDRVRLVPKVSDPPPWRVIFQVAGPSSTTIGLDVRQSLVIGRADPGSEQGADLDLSPHRAQEHGVSRQHAVLIPASEGLFLTDLESTNGTWINSAYLEPGRRHLLVPGDRVELGLLCLIVRTVAPLSRTAGHE